MRAPRRIPERRAGMGAADGERQLVDVSSDTRVPRGDPVERRILVEAPHMGDPFDDFALAADRKRLPGSRDRQRRQVDARRRSAVDRDLRLAGETALVERRQIHERELDRPLDLVRVGTGQKHDGARRIDARDRPAQPVRPRIGEKTEDRLLRCGGTVRSARAHGSFAGNALPVRRKPRSRASSRREGR